MRTLAIKNNRRQRRMLRVRKRVEGCAARPRLAVSRSNAHLYVQVIDDFAGRTLCALSTLSKEFRTHARAGGNVAAAKLVGKLIGERAKALGITQVCFDRRGARYHGRVKALADAAREAGLKF